MARNTVTQSFRLILSRYILYQVFSLSSVNIVFVWFCMLLATSLMVGEDHNIISILINPTIYLANISYTCSIVVHIVFYLMHTHNHLILFVLAVVYIECASWTLYVYIYIYIHITICISASFLFIFYFLYL